MQGSHRGVDTYHVVGTGKIGGHDVSFEFGDARRKSREVAREPAAGLARTSGPARRPLRKDRCGDKCKNDEERCDSALHRGAFHWGATPTGRPGGRPRRPVYSFAGRIIKSIFPVLRSHSPSGFAVRTDVSRAVNKRSMGRRLHSRLDENDSLFVVPTAREIRKNWSRSC